MGGASDAADGGAEVASYDLEWSLSPHFSPTATDAGSASVTGAYTARNLTHGERYYVRVAARNVMGFSAFCAETGNTCASGLPASGLVTNSTR